MKIITSQSYLNRRKKDRNGEYRTTVDGKKLGLAPPYQYQDTSEVDIKIYYTASPGSPGVSTFPNGDPGYTGDTAQVEVYKIVREDTGEDITDIIDMTDPMFRDTMSDKIIEELDEEYEYNKYDYEEDFIDRDELV